jgi:ribosomal peptide maturation radical SAM protein 1
MPWQALHLPSIQVGILQTLLGHVGIRTEVRSFYLAFMQDCRQETAGRPPDGEIRPAEYDAVTQDHYHVGLGEWIFAVPPFRDDSDVDNRYLAYLQTEGIPEADIAKAIAMRAVVPAFLKRCASDILATGARVVGFTSTFSQTVPSLVLAKILKQRDPSLAVMFGGANCDGPMGAALHQAFPWVDVVVRGEAEGILPGLVKDLLANAPVRPQSGLCYRDTGRRVAVPQAGDGTVPLDEIPTPVYDEYFTRLRGMSFAEEIAGDIQLLHETARGCWWGVKSHCTFCGRAGLGMTFRSKSPDRVIHELTTLAARYGRLDFQAVDNILDLHYLCDVLPRLRDA